MSAQLDPQVHVEWMVVPEIDRADEWQHVGCCAAPQPSVDPQPPAVVDDEEWWPGRCIP